MKGANRLFRGERGSVLPFLTISMTVLIAFSAGVMDIGLMYETRRQLQNGVDGAALAGAWELADGNTQAQAINAALDYAQRNGIPVSQIDPGYPQVGNENPYSNNAVVVAATRHLNLLVAGLFNNGVGDVRAQATAVVGPVLPTEALWPWGVPQSDVVPRQLTALTVGDPLHGEGNCRSLDFPPSGGASDYENDIKNGHGAGEDDYMGALPWNIPIDNGDMTGPTRQGVEYLVDIMAASSGQDDLSSPWNQPTPSALGLAPPRSPPITTCRLPLHG